MINVSTVSPILWMSDYIMTFSSTMKDFPNGVAISYLQKKKKRIRFPFQEIDLQLSRIRNNKIEREGYQIVLLFV